MTFEKALDRFQAMLTECSIWCKENQLTEMFESATEALERQIPKKPYMESDGDADGYPVWDYYCECCNEYFDTYEPKYCWKCGQALSWEGEE